MMAIDATEAVVTIVVGKGSSEAFAVPIAKFVGEEPVILKKYV
jgi:hypothetical protein